MDEQLIFQTAQLLLMLYLAYKMRQSCEHLRVLRKHFSKKSSPVPGLSPERAAAFRELTGRDPEPARKD